MSFQQIDLTERKIVSSVIDSALARNYTISVYDGEEYSLKRSTDKSEILKALASTESDVLHFRTEHGARIGWVWLIYGNGEDIISDWSDNKETDELVKPIIGLAA
jgi:hypothetical protein